MPDRDCGLGSVLVVFGNIFRNDHSGIAACILDDLARLGIENETFRRDHTSIYKVAYKIRDFKGQYAVLIVIELGRAVCRIINVLVCMVIHYAICTDRILCGCHIIGHHGKHMRDAGKNETVAAVHLTIHRVLCRFRFPFFLGVCHRRGIPFFFSCRRAPCSAVAFAAALCIRLTIVFFFRDPLRKSLFL